VYICTPQIQASVCLNQLHSVIPPCYRGSAGHDATFVLLRRAAGVGAASPMHRYSLCTVPYTSPIRDRHTHTHTHTHRIKSMACTKITKKKPPSQRPPPRNMCQMSPAGLASRLSVCAGLPLARVGPPDVGLRWRHRAGGG
jgi:hypothetical protein